MKNKKKLLLIIIPIVLIAAMVTAFFAFRPKTQQGSKAVVIEVVDNEKNSKVYTVKTDAEFLRQAMEETKGLTFSGTESEYGLMVSEINGVTADYNVDQSYWAFYVNGEYCQYGIDSQPVYDGDQFKIEYTK